MGSQSMTRGVPIPKPRRFAIARTYEKWLRAGLPRQGKTTAMDMTRRRFPVSSWVVWSCHCEYAASRRMARSFSFRHKASPA